MQMMLYFLSSQRYNNSKCSKSLLQSSNQISGMVVNLHKSELVLTIYNGQQLAQMMGWRLGFSLWPYDLFGSVFIYKMFDKRSLLVIIAKKVASGYKDIAERIVLLNLVLFFNFCQSIICRSLSCLFGSYKKLIKLEDAFYSMRFDAELQVSSNQL